MAELHQIRRNHAIKRAKPNDDKVWFSTDTGTPPLTGPETNLQKAN